MPAYCPDTITPAQLHAWLTYDPVTGDLRNRISRGRAKKGALAGWLDNGGYVVMTFSYERFPAHHIIWAMQTGKWPTHQVDHINGVRDDLRWCNLEHVTPTGNNRNSRLNVKNTSGCSGVGWDERRNHWYARIKIDGKSVHIGVFTQLEDAVAARKQAELKYEFHPNHGTTNRPRYEHHRERKRNASPISAST